MQTYAPSVVEVLIAWVKRSSNITNLQTDLSNSVYLLPNTPRSHIIEAQRMVR